MNLEKISFSDRPNTKYKGFVISPFTITKLIIGDKIYVGWTIYNLIYNNAIVCKGGKQLKFDTISKAKRYITKYLT